MINSFDGQSCVKNLTEKPKRLQYIDTARFLAIILVVLGHALGRDNRFSSFIYTFHLPLFFILNGMTLKIDKSESFGNYLEKKIRTYFVPIMCLGVLEVLLTALVNNLTKVPMDNLFIGNKLIDLLTQSREYTIWFVAALFVSDILFYFAFKLGKGKIVFCGIFSAFFLFIGIVFNHYYPFRNFAWNIDVALFGVAFVYLGYLFSHNSFSKVRNFLLKNRWISLAFAIILLTIGLGLGQINYVKYHLHLEMWGRSYSKYYLVLPSAIIASFGFILLSNTLRNKILGELGKTTLVILAFHQIITIPIFNNFIARDFWISTFKMLDGDYRLYAFALLSTLFSLATLIPTYYAFKYSPFAFMIGKKMPNFYKRLYNKIIDKFRSQFVVNSKNKLLSTTEIAVSSTENVQNDSDKN